MQVLSEMLLIFFSRMDFFIGIVAYFRFMGIILHGMDQSLCAGIPTHAHT